MLAHLAYLYVLYICPSSLSSSTKTDNFQPLSHATIKVPQARLYHYHRCIDSLQSTVYNI